MWSRFTSRCCPCCASVQSKVLWVSWEPLWKESSQDGSCSLYINGQMLSEISLAPMPTLHLWQANEKRLIFHTLAGNAPTWNQEVSHKGTTSVQYGRQKSGIVGSGTEATSSAHPHGTIFILVFYIKDGQDLVVGRLQYSQSTRGSMSPLLPIDMPLLLNSACGAVLCWSQIHSLGSLECI